MGTLIKKYKAGWSLHSKRCCSPSPTSISHCQYKDTTYIWHHQINPHIYFTNSFKHIVNNFFPTYMGGLSVWHTPSPHKKGWPPPPYPPSLWHNVRGQKGGQSPKSSKIIFNWKVPLYPVEIFWEKNFQIWNIPNIIK